PTDPITITDTDTDPEPDLPEETTGGGSDSTCRMSEAYGAAGNFPAYTDPNYASFLDKPVAIMTSSTTNSQYVVRVFDISGDPPLNANYPAPMYIHPTWTQQNLGRVFGLTIDSRGDIYVTPTTVFGATSNYNTVKRIDS
ncbi:MAG: hypothetical protein KC636_12520, partial [Myxococcales bacterium]|nr:hypothetical protein [Myxococcales bacterium]